MNNQATAIPADDRAHHLALSIAAIIEELATSGNTDLAIAMAEDAKAAAEQLCDDLDPFNPDSLVPPARPDWLGAAQLAVRYGENVVPFAPR